MCVEMYYFMVDTNLLLSATPQIMDALPRQIRHPTKTSSGISGLLGFLPDDYDDDDHDVDERGGEMGPTNTTTTTTTRLGEDDVDVRNGRMYGS
jgi:hypothetical protein